LKNKASNDKDKDKGQKKPDFILREKLNYFEKQSIHDGKRTNVKNVERKTKIIRNIVTAGAGLMKMIEIEHFFE